MADEDDLKARKARAEDIRAQISNILGQKKKGAQDEETKAENEIGETLPGKTPSFSPPSPREFIERRMRELDSAKDIDPGKSSKDKTTDPSKDD